MTRPQGTPGRFTFGCGTFHAILDRHGTYWWQSTSGHWYEAPPRAALMIAPRFEVDRAWHRANNEDDRPAADREAALWELWSADLHHASHDQKEPECSPASPAASSAATAQPFGGVQPITLRSPAPAAGERVSTGADHASHDTTRAGSATETTEENR